jgi:micrococcal nuclease
VRPLVVPAGLLVGLLVGCAAEPAGLPRAVADLPVPALAQEAVVVRHTDGDTLVLRGRGTGPLGGQPTKVRLLLVDTPEDGEVPECGGPEASAALERLVPVGSTVRVAADRQLLDRFRRTLLYVWDDRGTSVNLSLLIDGHARVLVVRPNVEHVEAMREAEALARFHEAGLWGCPRD